MEILNTYNDAAITALLTVVLGVLTIFFVVMFVMAVTNKDVGIAIASVAFSIILGTATVGASMSTIEYTDAIVADWNEVYEQGYEVVSQDGKIVTLRKVDE